jgi:hypothetical protein
MWRKNQQIYTVLDHLAWYTSAYRHFPVMAGEQRWADSPSKGLCMMEAETSTKLSNVIHSSFNIVTAHRLKQRGHTAHKRKQGTHISDSSLLGYDTV